MSIQHYQLLVAGIDGFVQNELEQHEFLKNRFTNCENFQLGHFYFYIF